jgi:hypothetical protein
MPLQRCWSRFETEISCSSLAHSPQEWLFVGSLVTVGWLCSSERLARHISLLILFLLCTEYFWLVCAELHAVKNSNNLIAASDVLRVASRVSSLSTMCRKKAVEAYRSVFVLNREYWSLWYNNHYESTFYRLPVHVLFKILMYIVSSSTT